MQHPADSPLHDTQDTVHFHGCVQALDSLGDPLLVLDPELRIISANRAFKEMLLGFGTSDPVIGRLLVEVFPCDPSTVIDEYKQVFATGQVLVTSRELSIGDREIYTETRKIPILKDGKVIRVVTVIHDATEHRLLEQTLTEYSEQFHMYRVTSEQRFHAIFDASPVSICMFDTDGILTDANSACARMFGMASVHDVLGFDISGAQDVPESVMEMVRNGEQVDFEWVLDMDRVNSGGMYETSKTGIMHIGVIVSPLVNSEDLNGWIVQMQDITGWRRSEMDLRHATAQAMEYMDMMSHDIANQLQSMVMCSGLLSEAAHSAGKEGVLAMLDESISECIKTIMQAHNISTNADDNL
jgi:PAS domain S-box-containing protein